MSRYYGQQEIISTPHRFQIKEYEILGYVGRGATGIVFAAVHRGLLSKYGVERKVALKFIWDQAHARDELQRLSKLDTNPGANNLIHYIEVPYKDVAELLEPFLLDVQVPTDEKGWDLGMLVLQFAYGQSVVTSEPLDPNAKNLPKGAWTIEVDGREVYQNLSIPMSFDEKVTFLRGMMRVLSIAHEKQPPEIHGDLHPGNVVYDRDQQNVILIDWGSLEVCGADGWISPWHDQLVLGEIRQLPPEADVFVMNLWIQRLLAPELGSRIQQFMKLPSPEHKVSMSQLQHKFEEGLIKRNKRWRIPTVAGALALIALVWWVTVRRIPYENQVSEIQNIVTYALAHPEEAKAQATKLSEKLAETQDGTLRNQLIRGIATIKLSTNRVSDRFLAQIDFAKPDAILISAKEPFVIYGQWTFPVGSPINSKDYIAEILPKGLRISSTLGDDDRYLSFPEHSIPTPSLEPSLDVLIIYSTSLATLLQALSNTMDKIFFTDIGSEVLVFGLLRGENTLDIYRNIILTAGAQWQENSAIELFAPGKNLRIWELSPTSDLYGRLPDLIQTYLIDGLGFESDPFPAEFREARVYKTLTHKASCVSLFQALSLENGYQLIVEGNRIRYIAKDP